MKEGGGGREVGRVREGASEGGREGNSLEKGVYPKIFAASGGPKISTCISTCKISTTFISIFISRKASKHFLGQTPLFPKEFLERSA